MTGAPTLDSEMGASREGATGVLGERTWLTAVGDPSRSSTLRAALRRDPTPGRARLQPCRKQPRPKDVTALPKARVERIARND